MEDNCFKINRWLCPLAWLYGAGVNLRNKLFDWNIFRSKSFDVPVVCIGNLAVGGTGKTPHTEYLIRMLHPELNVAVLSRGYKRHTKGYLLATPKDTAERIGDEPFQIYKKFPHIRVAVDEVRCHGIEQLLQLGNPPVDVVLLDDAFQHRYVKAGLYILLTDYHHLFCDDALLPMGRLREPAEGRKRAHIIIVTKCPADIKPIDYNIIAKKLELFPYQSLYFSTFRYGNLQPVFPETGSEERTLGSIDPEQHILLLTGIASPTPLVKKLKQHTLHIDLLSFADHHNFSEADLQTVQERFLNLPEGNRLIITTEKDATRLENHPELPDELAEHIYSLPIEIEILQNQQDIFHKQIIEYVTKN